jgi:hypothetical protein
MLVSPFPSLKLPVRSIIAATMMVLYLFISLSPLLAPALRSKAVLHALTGECSGDCDICDCSAESRATQTCCCSMKKQQQARAHLNDGIPDCCKKTPAPGTAVIASCGCPCGSGKTTTLAAGSSSELLPYYFRASLKAPHSDSPDFAPSHALISRHAEPPDPPPRQA